MRVGIEYIPNIACFLTVVGRQLLSVGVQVGKREREGGGGGRRSWGGGDRGVMGCVTLHPSFSVLSFQSFFTGFRSIYCIFHKPSLKQRVTR